MNASFKAIWVVPVLVGLMGCAVSDHMDPNGQPIEVSVMSFNIRYGTANDGPNAWPHRRELVFKVIKDHPADFVGVQEAMAFQTDQMRRALRAYDSVARSREATDGEGEATPIFYRADRWRLDRSETFWLSDTPAEPGSKSWGNTLPRIVTWARFVEKRSGRGVYVFNTHFDHRSQPSRVRSASLLLERVVARRRRGEPVLVTGDFNAGEDNPAILDLKEGGLIDTFRVVFPEALQVGTFGGWVGNTGGAKIDYVFVTPDVRVLKAAILDDNSDGRYPSDHLPVIATVELFSRAKE